MKMFFWIGMILASVTAQAQTVEVANIELLSSHGIGEYWSRMNDFQVTFNINQNLGRAWVEVNIAQGINGPGREIDRELGLTGRWLVLGLRYDSPSSKVMYNDIAVADVKPGLFGLGYYIVNTRANLKLDIIQEPVDDGFNIYQEPFEIITMTIN